MYLENKIGFLPKQKCVQDQMSSCHISCSDELPQVAEPAPGPDPFADQALPQDLPKSRAALMDTAIPGARLQKVSSLPLLATACVNAFPTGAAQYIRWASRAPSPS